MSSLIEILKIIVALAVLLGIGYYWFTDGLPPRGKGRWRKTLDSLEGTKRHARKPGQK